VPRWLRDHIIMIALATVGVIVPLLLIYLVLFD